MPAPGGMPAPAPAAPAPTTPAAPITADQMGSRFVSKMEAGEIPDYEAVYRDLGIDYSQLQTNQTFISRMWHYMDGLDAGNDHANSVQYAMTNAG
jgi:hypothetical protein